MFIWDVTKIFFRNKKQEIGSMMPNLANVGYGFMIGIVAIAVIAILFCCAWGFAYGLGYLTVEVLGITVPVNEDVDSYGEIGLVVIFLLLLAGFISYFILLYPFRFIKWIWTNIKMAIAEAKELR